MQEKNLELSNWRNIVLSRNIVKVWLIAGEKVFVEKKSWFVKFEERFSINIVVSVTFNIFFTFVPTCSICNNIFSVLDVISMADLDYIII